MKKNKVAQYVAYAVGGVVILWFSLLIAPDLESGGFTALLEGFDALLANPFRLTLCDSSFVTALFCLLAYVTVIVFCNMGKRHFRKGVEHGSAEWGSAKEVNSRYRSPVPLYNKILSRHVSIGLDGRRHRRNLNTLVVGGSGAGKTRFYAKPNLLNANTSYVILDPKGELLRDTGALLKEQGYEIKVLDLINMERSDCYNPFTYLRDDNDIQRLVTNLFQNTGNNRTSQDPFWEQSAMMLLMALVLYLHHEAPKSEQNFSMVMELIRAGEIKEFDDSYRSPLDILFEQLEAKDPNHIAVKYYKAYHSGAGKTLKSIQITLISKLEKFNLDSLASITQSDDLELAKMGERKTALYVLIPDNDSSFNFLIGMLYTQLFQQLYYQADVVHGGRLPVHVHFLMDEFANLCLPSDFDKLLSTMRSREISVSIILQNMAQLKALYDKQWESIVGNCDEFLYLGGNEQSTHEYVSELLGKETIQTNTYARARGRAGTYTTNWQMTGRDLMTPSEVRLLSNDQCILFIRGEMPIMDDKYDLMRHPNIRLTPDGGAAPYRHGEEWVSYAAVRLVDCDTPYPTADVVGEDEYLLYTDVELERIFHIKEGEHLRHLAHPL